MKLDFIQTLFEAGEGPRIPHPEDAIFESSAAAARYVQGLKEVVTNPGSITIKWDGGIALVFGRNAQGQFYCADKYMPAKEVYPTSPEGWVEYDRNRGADRNDLYEKINLIWSGLEASVGPTAGSFKGDLMSVGVLKPVDGNFIFSPTTVEYRVPVNSTLGNLIAGKVGIVAVHQHNGSPWDGKSGLGNNGNVAILSPTAGIKFKLSNPVNLVKTADSTLQKYGAVVDKFLGGMDGVARVAIQKYFNHKITQQTNEELVPWLVKSVSAKQYKILVGENQDGYLIQNQDGYQALRAVWNSIYALKVNLAEQLEPQIQGFEQYTGGQKAGEGFVFNSKTAGLVKLVNRGQFGVAHFNK
jgi:hypothetical protein